LWWLKGCGAASFGALRPRCLGLNDRKEASMSVRYWLVCLAMLWGASATASQARAQAAYGPASRQSAPTSNYPAAGAYQRSTGGNNAALNFYGRPKSMQFAPQSRAKPLPPPRPGRAPQTAKPFSRVQQTSSISPYLALDNIETSTSLPNYFLFVRPQLDYQAQVRAQNARNWKQHQQTNAAAASAAAGYPESQTATTGHGTQFMNSGGYYPGLR